MILHEKPFRILNNERWNEQREEKMCSEDGS